MYQISKPIGFVLMFIASIMWLRNWQLNFENADLKKKIENMSKRYEKQLFLDIENAKQDSIMLDSLKKQQILLDSFQRMNKR
jgi:type II secretory pathway component GspD/PulD (secretin)